MTALFRPGAAFTSETGGYLLFDIDGTASNTIIHTEPTVDSIVRLPDIAGTVIVSAGEQDMEDKEFTDGIQVDTTTGSFTVSPDVQTVGEYVVCSELGVQYGNSNVVTVFAESAAAPSTYALPNYGAGAEFIMTEGDQSISYDRTFGAAITAPNLTGTNTGDLSLTAMGSAPNAAGASLSGQALTLQPADATHPGLISNTAQTFAGLKTFTDILTAGNLTGATNTGDVTLTAVGSSPAAAGASLSGQALTLQPTDGTQPGLMTAGTQTIGGNKTYTGTVTASNLSGTNTGDLTLAAVGSTPNSAGFSLSGQVLNMQPADGTNPGVVTTGAQTIGGNKTFPSGLRITQLITNGIWSGSLSQTSTWSQTLSAFPGAKVAAVTTLSSVGYGFTMSTNGRLNIAATPAAGAVVVSCTLQGSLASGSTVVSMHVVKNGSTIAAYIVSQPFSGSNVQTLCISDVLSSVGAGGTDYFEIYICAPSALTFNGLSFYMTVRN